MKIKYGLLMIILISGCQDKYMPNINVPASGFLVVEGFINAGTGPTVITLTRASSLDSPAIVKENGATIEVQSQSGASYPLSEDSSGSYSVNQIPVDNTQQYRLHIKTSNGKEYLSAYAPVNIAPPIDSVSWSGSADGVTISVTAHDPQNKVQYYSWQYVETWQYNSAYESSLKYVHDSIQLRSQDEYIYNCWRSDLSTNISIASSATLSSAVIYEYPLTLISYATTDKLAIKYSILVKQYALSKDWYEWQQKIKKNTEQVGSIFDAQPSETGGNIVCTTNPTEMVIGFIGCSSETDKRIFISRTELPPAIVFTGNETCAADTVANDPTKLSLEFSGGYEIPIDGAYANGQLIGYTGSTAECVDCRLKGGTLTKPSFWQ
jgi:Domain of unknown function (DUF4249)